MTVVGFASPRTLVRISGLTDIPGCQLFQAAKLKVSAAFDIQGFMSRYNVGLQAP